MSKPHNALLDEDWFGFPAYEVFRDPAIIDLFEEWGFEPERFISGALQVFRPDAQHGFSYVLFKRQAMHNADTLPPPPPIT